MEAAVARRLTLEFLKTEVASGTLLGLAAFAALVVANSPWSADYFAWLKSEHVLQLGPVRLEESISDWIKEGLMAVFFLVVGLEIKYEILRGELSDPRRLATPVLAALGGLDGLPPDQGAILLLKDFHRYADDPGLCRRLRNLAVSLRQVPHTLVISAAEWQMPRELEDSVTLLELPLQL
jgi:hypothetical protein